LYIQICCNVHKFWEQTYAISLLLPFLQCNLSNVHEIITNYLGWVHSIWNADLNLKYYWGIKNNFEDQCFKIITLGVLIYVMWHICCVTENLFRVQLNCMQPLISLNNSLGLIFCMTFTFRCYDFTQALFLLLSMVQNGTSYTHWLFWIVIRFCDVSNRTAAV